MESIETAIVFVLLALIVIPVSAAITGPKTGAFLASDNDQAFTIHGKLMGVNKEFAGKGGMEEKISKLGIFTKSFDRLYEIKLVNGDAQYFFYAFIPGNLKSYLNKSVAVRFKPLITIISKDHATLAFPIPDPDGIRADIYFATIVSSRQNKQ